MEHKHLIIRAEVQSPPTDQKFIEAWLVDLTKKINMNVAAGPVSSYVTKKGNEGLTATVLIETSHIVIHVWDKMEPPLIQFDLYSCGEFSIQDVAECFYIFIPIKVEYKYLDRNNELIVVDEGRSYGGNGVIERLDHDRIQWGTL